MEQVDERKMWVKVTADETGLSFETPQELLEILWGKMNLLGLCLQLYYLSRLKIEGFISQPNLAKILGMDYGTYLKKRKELEDLKLLKVIVQNHNITEINLTFFNVVGLRKNLRGSKEKPLTPPDFRNYLGIMDYLHVTGDSLVELLKKDSAITGQPDLFNNIYINNTSNTNKVNIVKRVNSLTVKNKTYPKEDYTLVIDAFKKYKGVGLVGPEISYHLRAIKMMFQAEHKPKDIIDFMKWLHDNERNEETAWVRNWTIWTVQKKIPEFLGGKLKVKSTEEEFPAYGK